MVAAGLTIVAKAVACLKNHTTAVAFVFGLRIAAKVAAYLAVAAAADTTVVGAAVALADRAVVASPTAVALEAVVVVALAGTAKVKPRHQQR